MTTKYKMIALTIAWLGITALILERQWLAEKEIQEMVERNHHIFELLNERIDDAQRKMDIYYQELRRMRDRQYPPALIEHNSFHGGWPEGMVQ